jgi:hypothetical protein
MRLICYPTSGEPPRIVAAPFERGWMDNTQGEFAYRCLPLNIANAHGWMLLNTAPFIALWDGRSGIDAIRIESQEGAEAPLAVSHFGHGVLTFTVNALFRGEAGYDLIVTGPFNQPKDALQPLTGVVETDWSPFTFTMNWKFTRRGTSILLERDEPFCMIFPVKRDLLENTEPIIVRIEDDPEVSAAYREWAESRRSFNENMKVEGSEARKQKWQKEYFRGAAPFGTAPEDHRTKLRVREFAPSLPAEPTK